MFQRTEKGAKVPHHPCGLGHLETSEHLCVFEGARPCISVVLQVVANESSLWCFAGASVVHELLIWSLNLGTEVTSCLVLPLVGQAKMI
jgi:hypothetical protein